MAREEGLYKDKIEVSLDGRQIFYLFFGGSVIVGLVFVLGVMVGRRVEARGHVERARTAAAVDPLAALDRLEGGGLSYQGALRGGEPPASDVEKLIRAARVKKTDAKPAEVVKSEPRPETKRDAKPAAKSDAKPDAKSEAKIDAKPDAKPDAKGDAKINVKPDAKGDGKSNARSEAKSADKPRADADKPKAEPKLEKKPRFALQLSSFQDKAEAQAYLEQVKANGLSAYLTEAEVDSKTFYRVRVGKYASVEAASDAKVDIDKATRKSASIVKQ